MEGNRTSGMEGNERTNTQFLHMLEESRDASRFASSVE
jgi:hypothetical protein